MRADSWFRRYWYFAFPLPFFRLRFVFATPADRLRERPGKALGISNLRFDSLWILFLLDARILTPLELRMALAR